MSALIDNMMAYGNIIKLEEGDYVYHEGDRSQHFHYLIEGGVSIVNSDAEGRDFIQLQVLEKHFFGEAPFILEAVYPASALVTKPSEIFRIGRAQFMAYIRQYPEDLLQLTKEIAQKAVEKSMKLKNLIYGTPEEKLLSALEHFKGDAVEDVEIPHTRKELAQITGLCTETVIRTVKKMEKDGKLKIINRKIHF
ncbi:Crp/Fnr family transcriptional regulator [Riemerella columbina]|uniref:Crp/Fnr family transcriptional regulator n=1 Tax=Riemerella columbina TaxID=103810 RepID=UPI00266FF34E|nr:Crp/Fnr family transcriptional regulator [Riemerella columbina]WKS94426.1 Crp/Fnr family transcriptional regulator [Riemerella columbina]